MKAFLFLLLATVSTLAQFGGESIRPWEPRDIRTKSGLFAQYDFGRASSITLNGSGISKCADISGNVNDGSRDLNQSTAANQPIYDTTNTLNGKATAYFDGSAHYLKTAGMASLVQPETVVLVGKQVTWTITDRCFDGNAGGSGSYYQNVASPRLNLYAGSSETCDNTQWTVGSWATSTVIFNGASSSIQINSTVPAMGNPGTDNMAGFTLGAYGNGALAFGNIQVQHVLIFNQVLATPELNYAKYGGLRDVGALP